MKKGLFIFALITLAATTFASNWQETASTQAEMNAGAGEDAKKADAELNRIYQQVLAKAKNDPIATGKIRNAQQAWITFRDAEIEMWYPPRPATFYGSIQPVCTSMIYKRLTQERTVELKDWLKSQT